jgi:hypothetical protein
MSHALRRVAWLLGGVTLLLAVVSTVLIELNHLADPGKEVDSAGFVVFAVVGTFIAAKRPRNPIGWLFCAVGLLDMVWLFSLQYAVYTYRTHPGSLPGGATAAWLAMGWDGTIGWGLMGLFIPLLFPTGRLLSSRWRAVAVLGAVALGTQVGLQMIWPTVVDPQYLPSVRNPLAVGAVSSFGAAAKAGVSVLVIIALAGSVSSLLLRFRRAGVEERLQIKWFAYSAVVLAVLIVLGFANSIVLHSASLDQATVPLLVVAISALPISAAIAITKYRLYDIDILINRTLVYGSLTLMLAALYGGGVIGLQNLFRAVTGQKTDLAVAIVTLAVAAAFNPLRHRLQTFIDRRFYRRKYDAQRVLARFSATLRDEVGLASLSHDLIRVVQETVQPAEIGLWLAGHEVRS